MDGIVLVMNGGLLSGRTHRFLNGVHQGLEWQGLQVVQELIGAVDRAYQLLE
jgi:hypothetical protein